jgi:hypothetical protein
MGATHKTTAQRQWRNVDSFNAQGVQADQGADYIHNGVYTAQFVQMHLLERYAMDGRLHFPQATKDAYRSLLDSWGQVTLVYNRLDLGQAPGWHLVGDEHVHLSGAEAAFQNTLAMQVKSIQVQPSQPLAQRCLRQSGVQQRP